MSGHSSIDAGDLGKDEAKDAGLTLRFLSFGSRLGLAV